MRLYHPPMTRGQLAPTLGAASTALWLGTLTIAAATAAVAFPTIKALNPTLPNLTIPADDHWLITAGAVARKVFDISSAIQIPCAIVALIATLRLERVSPSLVPAGRLVRFLRRTGLALAIAALVSAIAVQLKMNHLIDDYWLHARDGKLELANSSRDAFRALHPSATRAQSACALGVLLATLGFILSARRKDVPSAG
jgi:hypothetical protein